MIVGDGKALPALKQQVAELGLEERIRFTGRVPNDKINDYLAVFDAVVCPRKSNIVTELVSPLKPIEAMGAVYLSLVRMSHLLLLCSELTRNAVCSLPPTTWTP